MALKLKLLIYKTQKMKKLLIYSIVLFLFNSCNSKVEPESFGEYLLTVTYKNIENGTTVKEGVTKGGLVVNKVKGGFTLDLYNDYDANPIVLNNLFGKFSNKNITISNGCKFCTEIKGKLKNETLNFTQETSLTCGKDKKEVIFEASGNKINSKNNFQKTNKISLKDFFEIK